MSVDHYTYRVAWSAEDGEHVGLCAEFPSLSWLAKSPEGALKGIRGGVAEAVADMQAAGEDIAVPLAKRHYSGEFRVRIPPQVHRVFALFKFAWSLRQFTHADAVRLGADGGREGRAGPGRFRADTGAGAMMVTHGFASFNRGLRAYFFGLAALAWFIQPWALVLAASWVVAVFYWRDSRSATPATLAGPVTGKELP